MWWIIKKCWNNQDDEKPSRVSPSVTDNLNAPPSETTPLQSILRNKSTSPINVSSLEEEINNHPTTINLEENNSLRRPDPIVRRGSKPMQIPKRISPSLSTSTNGTEDEEQLVIGSLRTLDNENKTKKAFLSIPNSSDHNISHTLDEAKAWSEQSPKELTRPRSSSSSSSSDLQFPMRGLQ